jgi:hypothetical protein
VDFYNFYVFRMYQVDDFKAQHPLLEDGKIKQTSFSIPLKQFTCKNSHGVLNLQKKYFTWRVRKLKERPKNSMTHRIRDAIKMYPTPQKILQYKN